MFKDYDWLLFDLDNTLLDFSQTSKRAFQELSEIFDFHKPDSYNTYHQINAKYWHYFEKHKINAHDLRYGRFKEFLETLGSKADYTAVAEKYLQLLIDFSEWIPGAENILKELSQTHRLVIITNGLKEAQHGRLEKHSMKQYFEHIFISEELGVSKPHQDFFQQVHQTIEEPDKNKVLVIGDNPKSDILGGEKFNYHTCWFNYHQEKKHHNIKANFKLESWSASKRQPNK